MADNYLERQYEAYQAKKAAWEKARKKGLVKPPKKPLVTKAENHTEAMPEE